MYSIHPQFLIASHAPVSPISALSQFLRIIRESSRILKIVTLILVLKFEGFWEYSHSHSQTYKLLSFSKILEIQEWEWESPRMRSRFGIPTENCVTPLSIEYFSVKRKEHPHQSFIGTSLKPLFSKRLGLMSVPFAL